MALPVERGERFEATLRWFEAQGGPVTISYEELSSVLQIPDSALTRILRRARELGLLRSTKNNAGWAAGQRPNTYRLIVKVDDWLERRDVTLKREKANRDTERREARRKRQQAREQLEEYDRITHMLEALEGPDPILARVEADVLGEAEIDDPVMVDAWLAGDF